MVNEKLLATYHATTGDGVGFEFTLDHVDISTPIHIKWDHDDNEVWQTTPWQSADFERPEALASALASYFATGEDPSELQIVELKSID